MRLVSRSEFADLANVSRPSVTKAARNGLRNACVDRSIDIDHPVAREYLRRHGFDLTQLDPDAVPEGEDPGPAALDAMLDLTLRELSTQHGSVIGFGRWLDAKRNIEHIKRLQLQNLATMGGLVSRELVRIHVFGALESFSTRLLRDTPKTLSRRLYALANAGTPIEEGEKLVREIIGSQLRWVKTTATRLLRPDIVEEAAE